MPPVAAYSSYSMARDGSEIEAEDLDFLRAVDEFKRRTGRRFPTLLELLHVARCLGYRRMAERVPVGKPRARGASHCRGTGACTSNTGGA